jgi:hypothetical protein
MERMLFRPFRLETWMVLGFAAFLSEYLSGGFGGSLGRSHHWRGSHAEFPHAAMHRVLEFIRDPAMLALVICIAALALALGIVLQWVSCRGRFVFLDDIVHERAAIGAPWKRYARQGNSLFVWTLLFWLAMLVAVLVIALPFFASLRSLWREEEFHWAGLLSMAGFLFMAIPVALAAAYTALFLNSFVVPIMYQHGLTATEAWGRFLTLLGEHPVSFLAYGLLMIVLWIAIGFGVMVVGFSTCCVGFLLVATPYVGQVFLLPVLATLRGFGPEFLAQFGLEFDVFATPSAVPAPPPAGTP